MKTKIRQHPRMKNILIGDEVVCSSKQLYARVEEVFPAAVCVKLAILTITPRIELSISPQLWRAEDIENLSVCRHCASRDQLEIECGTGIPFRVCADCRAIRREDMPA
jgi:hypothetical protein